MAQRFTAAISGLFSLLALAAEGDCRAHKESFSILFTRWAYWKLGTLERDPYSELHLPRSAVRVGAGTGQNAVLARSAEGS